MKKIVNKITATTLFLINLSMCSHIVSLSQNTRYETFNGENILIEDILDANKVDVEIQGNTLINMLDYSLMSSLSSTPNTVGVSINEREITRNYDITSGAESYWSSDEIIIKNGATYTFVADIISNTASKSVEVFPYIWKCAEWRKGSEYAEIGYTGKIVVSFKANQDSKLYLLNENTNRDLTGSITISNLMLLKGDYYDAFTSGKCKIPSYFEGIKSVGEDDDYINVFSGNSITENSSYTKGYGLVSGNNSLYKNNERNVLDYTKVKPNTTYKTNHKAVHVLNFFDENKSYLGFINNVTNFITPENCHYITASININYGDKVSIVEAEEELREDSFRMNLKEPLRGLPNGAKDRIIKRNGQWVVERNYSEIILDGSENWSISYNVAYIPGTSQKPTGYCISDKFICVSSGKDPTIPGTLQLGNNWFILTYIDTTLDEFKNWLSENPITLVYQLRTPIYEPLNIDPSINLYLDTTHISTNSTIPANMKVIVDRTINKETEAIELMKTNPTVTNIERARMWSNLLKESTKKDELHNQINNITEIEDLEIEKKTVSANIDLYIKSQNSLSMSLSTSSIIFDDFDNTEDMEKLKAVDITVDSSLPYRLSSYLMSEIKNKDGSNVIPKEQFNIRLNGESDYKAFNNINEKLVLKEDCSKGNDNIHGIDLILKGGRMNEADIYKTTIKFEAEQK